MLLLSVIDRDIVESKNFLDSHIEPWNEVLEAWRKTSNMRRSDLQPHPQHTRKKRKSEAPQKKLTVDEFLNKWPILKSADGYKLVLADFSAWFPEATNKISEKMLEDLIYKMKSYRLKNTDCNQVRWQTEVNEMQQKITSQAVNNNAKTAVKIKLLCYLLPPTTRANRSRKANVVDACKSKILHVQV